MDITLKLDPDEADISAIRDPLIAYNKAAAGRPTGYQPMVLHVLDEAGRPVGGLLGFALFDWLFVELLFVPEAARGQGMGSQLIARAEAFAREQGLAGVWLDTFSFQAPGFYEKLGYAVFGSIDDHPRGGSRFFLLKRLDGAKT